jgi:hypothetical protein
MQVTLSKHSVFPSRRFDCLDVRVLVLNIQMTFSLPESHQNGGIEGCYILEVSVADLKAIHDDQ